MLNYVRKGRGEPLLLLHGVGSHRQIAPRLARSGRARSATAPSPIGFASGRERAYDAALPRSSRAPARGLGRALDPRAGVPTWDDPAAAAAVLLAGPGSV